MSEVYTTPSSGPSSERSDTFDYWVQAIQEVCGALEAKPVRDEPFKGRAVLQRVATFDVVDHNVSIDRLSWSRRHVAAARDGYCFLLVQTAGRARVAQNGREAELKAGDCTIIDSLRPVEFRTDGFLGQLSFHLPREALTSRTHNQDVPCAVHISGDSGPGALLSSFARTLHAQAQNLGPGDTRYRDNFLDLLWAALPGVAGLADGPRDRQLQRIMRFIDEHLADPELGPAMIASEMNMSTRHLHRLFGETGASVGDWLRQRRLERSYGDLADPRFKGRSIIDIAFGWGFNDASHFSRTFRATYGISPRQHRQRALGG